MIQTFPLLPGVTLRCFRDTRFKQSCLSLQLVRPMRREEAALNALIPAVLLRGCRTAPDLRAITLRLDDLYGASVGALVRHVGDYHTTGLHCSFINDAYAMEPEGVLQPMTDFLRQLLLDPVTENGVFRRDYVESEKTNLIATIESLRNDKRAYASARLLRLMSGDDPFGLPRLGDAEQVRAITPEDAWHHYQTILRESPVELFYVGSADPAQVAQLLKPIFDGMERSCSPLPARTPFQSPPQGDLEERMDVAQGKLAIGFVTPITIGDDRFAAMQLCNMILGGGMTSKLFTNVREKHSLCYDIHSGYHGTKGILTVGAGIDCDKKDTVLKQVTQQLDACRSGQITDEELNAAKQGLCSGLRGVHDSPGAIENYYSTGILSGQTMTPAEYIEALRQVTLEQVSQAARTLALHTVFFLRGEQA